MDNNKDSKSLTTVAEHFLVSRFKDVEKSTGSLDKFKGILEAMTSNFITNILKTASISHHQSIGNPAADTTAANTLPQAQFAQYSTYLTWVKAQEELAADARDPEFTMLRRLISRKMDAMKSELVQSAEDHTVILRTKPILVTIAVIMVFVDMFVDAVVTAQKQRDVKNISADVLVAAQRALGPYFFEHIDYAHGDDNGLELVVPTKRPAPTPRPAGSAKRVKKTVKA
jgi:hypothetical protein